MPETSSPALHGSEPGCAAAPPGVRCGSVKRGLTRIAAVGALLAVAAIVVTDVTTTGVERWWDRHSVITDVVGSVLILAVTVLIVDEVIARRRVKERARVAAVQAVIVYGQALRTETVLANKGEEEDGGAGGLAEVRSLALMLLTAAPALFDDPVARNFMNRAEGFSSLMLRAALSGQRDVTDADRAKLAQAKEELRIAVQPMLVRLGRQESAVLEGAGTT